MPRIRKDAAVRRSEILDAAQRLIYIKGYESMTIQDILDEAKISKGGFFHHFESKETLLDALLQRMRDEARPMLMSIVQGADLSAIEKLQRIFVSGLQFKTERLSEITPLIRVWYSDENVLTRSKRYASEAELMAPLIAVIIRQGIQEGVFNTSYPDEAAEAFYNLSKDRNHKIVELLLAPQSEAEKLPKILALQIAYTDFFERILGAPAGSLHLFDPEMLKHWLLDLLTNI